MKWDGDEMETEIGDGDVDGIEYTESDEDDVMISR